MLNYIWAFMILFSIIFGLINGRLDIVATQALVAAKDAVNTVISLVGVMCFWSGMLKIAEQGGIIRALSRLLSPIIRALFPTLVPNGKAADAIISNMSANMLGMGNAATPFGIKAMQELDELNNHSMYASNAMCMFVVINTASIQLIPTTMIGVLSSAGATNPFDIIFPTIICSFIALIFGVLMCSALAKTTGRQKESSKKL